MAAWKTIKKWLAHGCIYYTVVSIVLILFALLGNPENAWTIPTNFWQILPASLAFALAGNLLASSKIARWKRVLLHYIIYMAAIYGFFFLPSDAKPQPISILLMWVLITVVYWAIFGLVLLIRIGIRRLMEEDN